MSELALTGEELLAWSDTTAERWRQLGLAHPEMLAVPCDIYLAKTVGEMLKHIVAVELRYAQRLADLPETAYSAISCGSPDELHRTHALASAMLRECDGRSGLRLGAADRV